MEANAILDGLNSEQRAAVECIDGPVLIVAGAGSGKTRVLTSRIAYMIEKGCAPESIMALTFTKKAASEMKERIGLMVGWKKARGIFMGTFHSVFIRFLREYSQSIGYPDNFTIYDTSDSISAIKACIKELNLDEKAYKPKVVLARISMAKNSLVTAAAYKANANAVQNDSANKMPHICNIYELYDKKCRQSGVMDFDDILLNMNMLLRDNRAALEAISTRFTHILVDEYQDTNFSQYLILRRLSAGHRNICVVGDDSQSIYAFRGAKIENILNFQKDFNESRIFRLEQNYRSTRTIVDAANSLIAKNEGRIPKKCFSESDKGEPLHILKAYTDKEEAELIVSSIKRRIEKEKAEYQDFAILYRTNAQSRVLEEYLRKRNVPYMIYSGNSFYERAEVKDLMAYFKLAVNPSDDEAFKRIINKPARGIGDTSLAALDAAAHKLSKPLIATALTDEPLSFGIRQPALEKIRKFCNIILDFHLRIPNEDAHSIALKLATMSIGTEPSLLRSFKEDNSIEGQSRAANVEELLNSVKSFIDEKNNEYMEEMQVEGLAVDGDEFTEEDFPVVTLGEYLENVSLLSAVDIDESEDSTNRVSLMTVHSSKGLEYPYVYIAGMEENLFPSGGMLAGPADIEEERRLFYVAITRAKKAVELSFAENRMRNGKTENNSPSRFVTEIDSQYFDNPLRKDVEESRGFSRFASRFETPRHKQTQYGTQTPSRAFERKQPVIVKKQNTIVDKDFVPTPVAELAVGMQVIHNRFGKGRIIEITGSSHNADLKARIDFDSYGEKILMLAYAKLMKL